MVRFLVVGGHGPDLETVRTDCEARGHELRAVADLEAARALLAIEPFDYVWLAPGAPELARLLTPAFESLQPDPGYRIRGFVGRARCLDAVMRTADLLRANRATVLVEGETGTGKELVARALHFDGPFADRPFIPIHCGAISQELLESELFGHEKGAFTGALVTKPGLFTVADGGTVFLDEIAETSPELQVKLLRVLQHGEVRAVGATRTHHVDVRIIAATNRDLHSLVRAGAFRADLFHRLEVVTLRLPPLRERVEDVPALVEHFIGQFNDRWRAHGRRVRGVSPGALALLRTYPWPGNVRELEHVIERAFALGATGLLAPDDLPEHVRSGGRSRPPALPDAGCNGALGNLRDLRAEREREAIRAALDACSGDKQRAARELQVPRSTFYRRLRELGMG